MRGSVLNFIAFLLVILTILQLVGQNSLNLPANCETYLLFATLVVLLLLQLDTFLLSKQHVNLRKLAGSYTGMQTELEQLQGKLRDEKMHTTELKARLNKVAVQVEETKQDYAQQLQQAQAKLQRLKNEFAQLEQQAAQQGATELPALQLLSLLQHNGRLIDFVMEDITGIEDQQVVAAARVVHAGCREVLCKYVEIHPLRDEEEGQSIVAPQEEVDRTVEIMGEHDLAATTTATLLHRGWKSHGIHLPTLTADRQQFMLETQVLYPAQAEVRS
ncbi:MAG: DUF2760 domain-containing protein [Zetaproteobacteria bacterium]|nr:DUF2760 domain-containing protein [Zetaproteobacteria bacterium]